MGKLFLVLAMFMAMNASGQWEQIPIGMGTGQFVSSLVFKNGIIFAGTHVYGTYMTTNNGSNWAQNGLFSYPIWSLGVSGNNLLAGTAGFGIKVSTNNGNTWFTSSLTSRTAYTFVTSGDNILCGTEQYGVYLSSNQGVNWIAANFNSQSVPSLAMKGSVIYAGTFGQGVFKSAQISSGWVQTSLNNEDVISLAVSDPYIFAGTISSGVFVTSNEGLNWVQTSLNNKRVNCFALTGSNLFAGTDTSGVYLSTNFGTTWQNISSGLGSIQSIRTLLIVNNYLFAGTPGNAAWRRPLSEVIGIQNISTEIPSTYSLGQNYPNPFNARTVVSFSLPVVSNVTLKIYDVIGREVQTLVNERMNAGVYETRFDGAGLNSGVYFYRMITDGYSETKRMTLIK